MQSAALVRDRLLSWENPREYRKDLLALLAALQPRDDFERMLVEEFAHARWEWNRARAVDCRYQDYMGGSYNRTTYGLAEADLYTPEKLARGHRHRMLDCERRYYRALFAVERMQRHRDRRGTVEPPPVAEPVSHPPERVMAVGGPAIVASARPKKRNKPKSEPASISVAAVQNEANGSAAALAPERPVRNEANRILRRAARKPIFAPRPAPPLGPAMPPAPNEANPRPSGPPESWTPGKIKVEKYRRLWRKEPDGSVKLIEICVT